MKKLRCTFLINSARKYRRNFRPDVEALEDRFQPSLTGLPLDGMEVHPITGFHHQDFVAQSTVADVFTPKLALNTATYATGTTGSAMARGTALGQDGSTYVTGTITLNGGEQGYVAKYAPNGTRDYLMTFQAVDNTAIDITFKDTEGHALAVDGLGNAYVAGTAIDASSGDHNAYTLKISADGTMIDWGIAFDGPNNVSTGDGIAVNDPNNNGNGQAVLTGTFTNTDATMGTVGDHIFAVRWTADGSNADFANFFTFGDGDTGSHGKAVALNTNSTNSTPGSLAYLAGNIILNGTQQTLAFQFDNGTDTGAGTGNWSATLTNSSNLASTTDTLTGVAVNPDDTSVYSGTVSTASASEGIVVSYPANASQGMPLFTAVLHNALSLNAIALDGPGNVYTTGAAANPSSGGIYVAALDHMGNFVSDLQFGDIGSVDAGYGVVATSSSSVWVVGDTTLSSLSTDGTTLNGTQDGFLASVTP
jgi:hypothetical protein